MEKRPVIKEDVWLFVMLIVMVVFISGLMGWILHLAIMG